MKNWTLKGLVAGKATTNWPNSGDNDGQDGVAGMPIFDPKQCSLGCQTCVQVCPTKAFSVEKNNLDEVSVSLDYGRCINCQICVETCPSEALKSSPQRAMVSRSKSDLVSSDLEGEPEVNRLQSRISSIFRGSLRLRHVDAGSCNGCESELGALNSPFYNLHRLGIFFTPSPRFADVLLVTGPVVPQMKEPLLRTWEAMPRPRFVVAAGTCAISGAPFDFGYSGGYGLSDLLPVDIFIPGCPPTPAELIHGLLLLTDRIDQKIHGGRNEP
ncbi:4Fe-4S dicluster domain-containing protein [Acidithrix sp. C25]|uniref:NADH-quinone oxidoreductase subunit B family protein n=1 Tax=Acidithrix sp. C25 TaxID=1671482 RepID=UPI00191BADA9|nr:4Fe-4S dicluster domain-containing protein [Acidithrix sp. C25]CAG4930611.1 unnamed protein product [Acidithrix sp. C25]